MEMMIRKKTIHVWILLYRAQGVDSLGNEFMYDAEKAKQTRLGCHTTSMDLKVFAHRDV